MKPDNELWELSTMPDAKDIDLIETNEVPSIIKALIVDDDELMLSAVGAILGHNGFEVSSATSVNDALKLIGSQRFDVLVTDLHMPEAGDGLTVVSAMRHSNHEAVTLILSSYPAMNEAATALTLQADDILLKPLGATVLVDVIRERLKLRTVPPRNVESIATILEDDTESTITDWLARVDNEKKLFSVKMDGKQRSAHLPQLFRDLVSRLSEPLPLGSHALTSLSAVEHGANRRRNGYTAAMLVEESRMLQVSIFQTLQNNLYRVNFDGVLLGVMAIADEVDSQLAQAMASYVAESKVDSLPTVA